MPAVPGLDYKQLWLELRGYLVSELTLYADANPDNRDYHSSYRENLLYREFLSRLIAEMDQRALPLSSRMLEALNRLRDGFATSGKLPDGRYYIANGLGVSCATADSLVSRKLVEFIPAPSGSDWAIAFKLTKDEPK